MMKRACRMTLMSLSFLVLACSCSGPCPPGTWARFERPMVHFDVHNSLAGYHVAHQPNRVLTVVFTNLQAELQPCVQKDLHAVSNARLMYEVRTRLKEPFYATVRVDFRYSAALSQGCHGGIRAWMNGKRMAVVPVVKDSRYEDSTQSFEFTHLFQPGERGDLHLSLHVERSACGQAARVGLNSLDVQLLVPPRRAQPLTHNTRT